MTAYVYVIHNITTRRNYVGITTTGEVDYRVEKHMYLLRTHRHTEDDLQRDYDKYGEESFIWRAIGRFNYEEAKRLEIFFMQVLRTQDRRYGYNCKDKSGTGKYAVADRWRTPTREWAQGTRTYGGRKH